MRANAPSQNILIYSRGVEEKGKWMGTRIGLIRSTFRRAAEIEEKYAHSQKEKKGA